ncbi:MAG TPA: hypothetical protein VFD08_02140 [Clostridia bacterium]|nr:hypothetical protein [Clostridia bacterium]
MVKIIGGGKGSGKTKRMIRMANEVAVDPHGSLFFIDNDNRNIFELNRNIRFINKDEFKINTPERLYGFLCGILAGDYDTEKIYIDGIDYIGNVENTVLNEFLEKLNKLALDNEAEFVLCFTTEEGQLSSFPQDRIL